MNLHLALVSALALAGMASQTPALAQHGAATQHAENARRTADLRAGIARLEARIGVAERSKTIDRTHATDLRRRIARIRREMADLFGRQGFVSAAEQASYDRALAAMDVELDARGIPRAYANDGPNGRGHGYGNDMLIAEPQRSTSGRDLPAVGHGYGDDALASEEVRAFQRTDARLRYEGARIERDRKGCAVYQGTTRSGRVRRERLLSAAGRPICSHR